MATIALFHSVLGIRPGLLQFADTLRAAGHEVHVMDQNEGKVFDEYEPAMALMEEVGFKELTARAMAATANLPDGFVTAGFSNGAGMAEYVAGRRRVAGVLMLGGALDLEWLDMSWPEGVPAQIHTTVDDPWREQEGIDAVAQAVKAAGGEIEVFDYPGSGHLFADSSKADEYQPAEADLMMTRIKAFLGRIDVK
jgi:dienelactone hydrolase